MGWIGSCFAGSSKTAPRILIFSIAMDADYSFEVKNIEIWAPAFFKHNNSFLATVESRDSVNFIKKIGPLTLPTAGICSFWDECRTSLSIFAISPPETSFFNKEKKSYALIKGHIFCTEIKILNSESHDLALLSLYTF